MATSPIASSVTSDESHRARIIDALEELYGPILVSIIFCAFYAFADPAQETIFGAADQYRIAFSGNETDVTEGEVNRLTMTQRLGVWTIVTFAMGSVIFVPISAWYNIRRIVHATALEDNPVTRWLGRLTVIACLALLTLGPIRTLWLDEADGLRIHLVNFAITPLILGGIFYYFRKRAFDYSTPLLRKGGPFKWVPNTITAIVLIVGAIVFALPSFAGSIGPVATVAIFFVGLTILLAQLTIWSEAMPGKFPLIIILIVFSLAMGQLYWSIGLFVVAVWALLSFPAPKGVDARKRIVLLGGIAAIAAMTTVAHFVNYNCASLAGCNKVPGIAGEPPTDIVASLEDRPTDAPLTIVAAQGGGLFAAYHTAFYLATKSDGYLGGDVDNVSPAAGREYRETLYAISGVSGGSVGAGVYWAIRASGVCERPDASPTCHRDAVRTILKHDYLSPALAGFFVRDFIDTFFPLSAWSSTPIDRGRVLENVLVTRFERWWERADGQLAETALLRFPLTAADGAGPNGVDIPLPVLVMNGTRVDTGGRVVASPLSWSPDGDWRRVKATPDTELTIATAMVMSARFPVVSPPLRILNNDKTVQIVDGGYFDNSGLDSAQDLITSILRRTQADPPEFRVVALTVGQKTLSQAEQNALAAQPIVPKGTIGAPVGAFVGAWRARLDLTKRRMTPISAAAARRQGFDLDVEEIEEDQANFTLSWFLAPRTFQAIEDEVLEDFNALPFSITGTKSAKLQLR